MNYRLLILLCCFQLTSVWAADPFHRKEEREKIDHFNVAAFPLPVPGSDSIEVRAYLEIPYLALQFLKRDSVFRADFQGTITLRDQSGYQYGRKIWRDSVVVDNYVSTISLSLSTITWTRFTVPPGKYHLVAEVTDMDTKSSGENSGDWDLTVFQGPDALFPPVVLVPREGEWGFSPGWIPLLNSEIRELEDTLRVMIYYKSSGTGILRTALLDKDRKNLWSRSYSIDTAGDALTKEYHLPPALFGDLNYSLELELEAGDQSYKQAKHLKIDKPGISRLVNDVDDALDQMIYILSDKERDRLKKARPEDREKLFKEFWKSRDPNPDTEQNELMDEYYRRIRYSNEHFSGFTAGWMTDMGMIYILFGPPDEVERTASTSTHRYYELWYYHRINRQFLFIDYNGFGDYRLDAPLVGDPFRGL